MSRVLITGGTEGIGKAFGLFYASIGYDLILVARSASKLIDVKNEIENAYPVQVEILVCDLSVIGSAQKLYDIVKDRNIDILINNAGIGYTEQAWKIDMQQEENMVVLNDISLMSLTKLFFKEMKENQHGTILNVASTGAFQPGPYIAGYYASKAFVLSYTEAIYEEAKEYGIHVYCLAPGPVRTEFYAKSGGKSPHFAKSAEDVVLYTVKHMKENCLIIPGFMNRIVRIFPKKIRVFFIKKMKYRSLKKYVSKNRIL